MGWRFRKIFKVLPGVRLNIGKKGLTSVNIGKRGLSTSVGKRGIFQNLGLPGTGLSHRSKVGGAGSFNGAILGLGIAAVVIIGVISLCVIFAAIGRNARQQEQNAPIRIVSNVPTSPTLQPTKTPPKKKSKRNG